MYISENDTQFGKRTFSDFVNGQMSNPKTVAAAMTTDHRYLQNEMFNVFYYYMRYLVINYHEGCYDARNEWACTLANEIITNTESIPDITGQEIEEYKELMSAIYKTL